MTDWNQGNMRDMPASAPEPAVSGQSAEPATSARAAANPAASGKQAGPARAGRPAGRSAGRRTIARWREYGVRAFAVLMLVGGFVGLLFFARPTVSAVEQRNLTAFPDFTMQRFLDGSFFSDLSLWYADTYPLREPLVQADHGIERLYGIQPETQLVGGNVRADEIPVAGNGDDASAAAPVLEQRTAVEPPSPQEMQANIQANVMNGLYVDGDRACSVYYFNQSAVDSYCAALNACAQELGDDATVYSVLIPNNSGALLDEGVLAGLGGSDQKQSLDYFHSRMDERIRAVETYDALRAHRDEYIYFRTDHHWTQLGAYYAYEQLCEKRGVEPANIESWQQIDNGPFLGTFYSELQLASMAANPDTAHAYIPTSTNDMTYWDASGAETQTNVVLNGVEAGYGENAMYLCFIAGDQYLSKISNPTKSDGSACLLVKDSYGCAFAPLLVDDYETVWIIDFREYDKSIPAFVRENGIQDVIFLNNMTIAGTDGVGDGLMQLMTP
ncbi:MAG TPA: hypothetical protein DCP91_06180 [Eggerthellaceae bacterium]|nr:hypothetical protein [Eggerthellaceae bacterium]